MLVTPVHSSQHRHQWCDLSDDNDTFNRFSGDGLHSQCSTVDIRRLTHRSMMSEKSVQYLFLFLFVLLILPTAIDRSAMCNELKVTRDMPMFVLIVLLLVSTSRIHSKFLAKHDECTSFLHTRDCYLFPCLDGYYLCGRDSHLVRFSYEFCQLSTQTYSTQLSTDAQLYFNHTVECTMLSLDDRLTERKITGAFTCANLQALIFNVYLDCLQTKQRANRITAEIDFCSIICDNLETMINLFLNLNTNFINLKELLIETGKSCGMLVTSSKTYTVPSLLIAICLDRKDARITKDITKVMRSSRFEFKEYEWL